MTRDAKKAVRQQAIEGLRKLIKPGDKIYTNLRHYTRSGNRFFDVYIIRNNEPRRITYTVGEATGLTYNRNHEALAASDKFEIVYHLSRELFADGFDCIGEGDGYTTRCPSNDHFNGDRDYTPHQHSDPGYALRYESL